MVTGCGFISQDKLIKLSKKVGEQLTSQTLRNYIKSDLCSGALGTENGIQVRGIMPDYPKDTIAEAFAAHAMLKVRGRKLDKIEVILAKKLGENILKGKFHSSEYKYILYDIVDAYDRKAEETLSIVNDKIIYEVFKKPTLFNIMEFDRNKPTKHKEYLIETIVAYAAEWIVLYANFSQEPFLEIKQNLQFVDAGILANVVEIAGADEKIYAGFNKRINGFFFEKDKENLVDPIYLIELYSFQMDIADKEKLLIKNLQNDPYYKAPLKFHF